MPLFFFDVSDETEIEDDDGIELEGLSAARIEAVRLAGELLRHYPDRFWSVGDWSCTVRDEDRRVLFVLNFSASEGPDLLTPPP